jgi:scyllo-inositol 2-dehydrogenase (NADP+)
MAIVAGGGIGEPALYEARWDRFRPEAAAVWRNTPRSGAGLLWDLGPHLVDQALALFGWPDAMTADVATQRAGAGADDYFELTLHYGARRAILSASTLVAATRPRMALHGTGASWWTEGLDPVEAALRAGERPSAPGFVAGLPPVPAFRATRDGERIPAPIAAADPCAFYRRLAAAIRSGAPVPVDPIEARDVVALIAAAAARTPPLACVAPTGLTGARMKQYGDTSGQEASDAAFHDHGCRRRRRCVDQDGFARLQR